MSWLTSETRRYALTLLQPVGTTPLLPHPISTNAMSEAAAPGLQVTVSKMVYVAKAIGAAKVKSDLLPYLMEYIVSEPFRSP